MRIEQDIKLDFADVLIRPKRSTLRSRKDVDILRAFTFKWTEKTWKGIPIIASNMDTVGTFSMAKVLSKFDMLTASEGETVLVPYKGAVENTILEILGGLRSACTYSGARRLKDLPKCTTFVRMNRQMNTPFLEK